MFYFAGLERGKHKNGEGTDCELVLGCGACREALINISEKRGTIAVGCHTYHLNPSLLIARLEM